MEEDDKKIKGGLTGSIRKPIHIPGKRVMITKNMILEAQKHTISNMAAARWMGIQYNTYKKYAKEFGVFEQHLNPTGKGIKSKGKGCILVKSAPPLTKNSTCAPALKRQTLFTVIVFVEVFIESIFVPIGI